MSSGKSSHPLLERRNFTKGTLIIEEGDPGSSAFLIQSGSVRIFSSNHGKKVGLSLLTAGEIFGEMSLIRGALRSASAEAAEDCTLIIITPEFLSEKVERSDPTIRALLTMLIRRVQSGNDSLMNKKPTIEDLQESLIFIYEEILSELPMTQKTRFRQELLPLIDEINIKLSEYKQKFE